MVYYLSTNWGIYTVRGISYQGNNLFIKTKCILLMVVGPWTTVLIAYRSVSWLAVRIRS